MKNKSKQATQSFPFLAILTLIFITLKLTDNIDWSWWWVMAPLWGTFAVVFTIGGIAFFIAGIVAIFSKR